MKTKLFGIAVLAACMGSSVLLAQARPKDSTRYFQITVDLKFGAGGDQQTTTQTITTDVAVPPDRSGRCKVRMLSQVPTNSDAGTKYIELGTKLDCDDVTVQGNGLTVQFSLETSRIIEMIKTKKSDGTEIEEPLITNRNVQLMVKLPLDAPKVVFDSSSKSMPPLKQMVPLNSSTGGTDHASQGAPPIPRQDPPLLIEMTATELK